jgi:RimJ/RimL family protein N-acetyltransferase
MRFWANPNPIVTEHQWDADLDGRFAQFDTSGYFIVEDLEHRPIGRIEFERLSVQERSAEVLILLGDEDARGNGYGTAAMVALLRYLFYQRDLHRVWLTILAASKLAIRDFEKVGFVQEGKLRQDVFFDGTTHDQLVMSILRSEFDEKWASTPPDRDS